MVTVKERGPILWTFTWASTAGKLLNTVLLMWCGKASSDSELWQVLPKLELRPGWVALCAENIRFLSPEGNHPPLSVGARNLVSICLLKTWRRVYALPCKLLTCALRVDSRGEWTGMRSGQPPLLRSTKQTWEQFSRSLRGRGTRGHVLWMAGESGSPSTARDTLCHSWQPRLNAFERRVQAGSHTSSTELFTQPAAASHTCHPTDTTPTSLA